MTKDTRAEGLGGRWRGGRCRSLEEFSPCQAPRRRSFFRCPWATSAIPDLDKADADRSTWPPLYALEQTMPRIYSDDTYKQTIPPSKTNYKHFRSNALLIASPRSLSRATFVRLMNRGSFQRTSHAIQHLKEPCIINLPIAVVQFTDDAAKRLYTYRRSD